MKAIVVYESHWGSTAAIARAIAEGIGPGARALSTAEADAAAIADADLIVAGAPVIGFRLATDEMLRNIATSPSKASAAPDISHPSMRSWLAALPPHPRVAAASSVGGRPAEGSSVATTWPAGLPAGRGRSAAFETRIWWSPGGATGTIDRELQRAGYRPLAKARRFIVKGASGPLREGEVERARQWGSELARAMGGLPGAGVSPAS